MKYLFSLLIFFTFLNANNSNDFESRQEQILLLKQIINEEESIARAYEEYILNELHLPESLDVLKTSTYLGADFELSDFDTTDTFTLTVRKNMMSNRLTGTNAENDEYIKALYQGDTFRKKTFYLPQSDTEDSIGFIIEDDFAKQLLYLSSSGGFKLLDCSDLGSNKYCFKDEHIYIYTDNLKSKLLMHYHKDKFKKGPIIITSDRSYHDYSEFHSISKGTILFDDKGKKYIKTLNGIKRLR